MSNKNGLPRSTESMSSNTWKTWFFRSLDSCMTAYQNSDTWTLKGMKLINLDCNPVEIVFLWQLSCTLRLQYCWRSYLLKNDLNLKLNGCDALGINRTWNGGLPGAICVEEYAVNNHCQQSITYDLISNQHPKHMIFINVCSQIIVLTLAEAIRLRAMLPDASTRKMTKAPAFLANFLLHKLHTEISLSFPLTL